MKCKDCVFEESYYEPSFETVCKITNKRTTSLQECTCDDERKAKLREQLEEVIILDKSLAERIAAHGASIGCPIEDVECIYITCENCWRHVFGLEESD